MLQAILVYHLSKIGEVIPPITCISCSRILLVNLFGQIFCTDIHTDIRTGNRAYIRTDIHGLSGPDPCAAVDASQLWSLKDRGPCWFSNQTTREDMKDVDTSSSTLVYL